MPTAQREIRHLTAKELIRLRRYAEARALQAKYCAPRVRRHLFSPSPFDGGGKGWG